ncbi:MAG TPA: hypothetical protein VKL99_00385, partial [Candidatus Angelobacter sp.]|nr:hypothetical protein [Candidatus Angelobacter sp.]
RSGKTTMAVAENDSDLGLGSIDAECDVGKAVAVEISDDGVGGRLGAPCGDRDGCCKTAFTISQHGLKLTCAGTNYYQKEVQMPIAVDVCERNRIRSARDGQKSARPKSAATSIQKYADVVQGWIGDNDVRLAVTIQVSDGSLVVLAMTQGAIAQ